jgi:hypothetical protein
MGAKPPQRTRDLLGLRGIGVRAESGTILITSIDEFESHTDGHGRNIDGCYAVLNIE